MRFFITDDDKRLAVLLAKCLGVILAVGILLAAGYSIGVGAQAPMIAELQSRAETAEASLADAVIAQAESAVEEIRTLYRGVVMRASFYGYESGKVTASGERYDPMRFTAAHRTLPHGTYLIVENIKNGRIVIVKKNDFGPNRRLTDRQLDLSYAAARELGMLDDGLATVRVTVIPRGRG